MLRQGPIPRFLHGVIDYVAGVLLIASPFLFGFDSGAATAVGIIAGVVVLAIAASTEGPTGMIGSIPTSAHVLFDFALAGALIAAPFLFGFSDDGSATAFFIIVGVVQLLLTIGTRFKALQG